eukprot:366351-Chlamydomonas_euryale.AAC.4
MARMEEARRCSWPGKEKGKEGSKNIRLLNCQRASQVLLMSATHANLASFPALFWGRLPVLALVQPGNHAFARQHQGCTVRPVPPPPSPYVHYGGRYGTHDDGSTGGRAGPRGGWGRGRCGHVLTLVLLLAVSTALTGYREAAFRMKSQYPRSKNILSGELSILLLQRSLKRDLKATARHQIGGETSSVVQYVCTHQGLSERPAGEYT